MYARCERLVQLSRQIQQRANDATVRREWNPGALLQRCLRLRFCRLELQRPRYNSRLCVITSFLGSVSSTPWRIISLLPEIFLMLLNPSIFKDTKLKLCQCRRSLPWRICKSVTRLSPRTLRLHPSQTSSHCLPAGTSRTIWCFMRSAAKGKSAAEATPHALALAALRHLVATVTVMAAHCSAWSAPTSRFSSPCAVRAGNHFAPASLS